MICLREWITPDATYDVCFNEQNPNQILSCGGDGTLKLWDLTSAQPIRVLKEHTNEVFNCEWNHINKRKILSASYDRTIKLWDVNAVSSEATFQHDFVVYNSIWHPTHESIFGSCSGD